MVCHTAPVVDLLYGQRWVTAKLPWRSLVLDAQRDASRLPPKLYSSETSWLFIGFDFLFESILFATLPA